MNRTTWALAVAGTLCFSTGALAAQTAATDAAKTGVVLPTNEQTFLEALHDANQNEIRLGQLAERQGASRDVRAYGKMLVDDHQQADKKVLQFAQKKGIQLGAYRPSGDVAQKVEQAEQAKNDALQALTGAMFDHQFMAAMVADHDHDLATVGAAMQRWPDLKPLLQPLLPTLQKHREHAYRLLGQLKFKGV